MAATFKFVSDAVDKNLFNVTSFSGTEGLSKLYRYEIHVKALTKDVTDLVDEKGLEDFVDEVLDHTARLITEEGGVNYPVHGMLAAFEENQSAGGYTYYTALLVPRLWKLSIYRTNEIFTTEKTVDHILETILDHHDFIDGSDYSMSLSGELLTRDYVCQFRESDFHFISRLMENEGIYYYFEQGETSEKLMIIDGADYPVLEKPDVIFDVNAQRRHESLSSWSRRSHRLPTHVSVRDYNPEQPSLDVHGTVDVDTLSDANGSGELCDYLYGDHFSNEEEAGRLARLRAEEIACRKRRYTGEGAVCGFRPGYTFKLKQHPNTLYNGRDYLIVEVSHKGAGLDSRTDAVEEKGLDPQYSNTFVAIENHLSFRPPLLTKKPRFYGTMTAFVYAEAATGMAEVDEQGRYRVHLPFDRADGGKESSDPNRKASCWVRMAQPFVGEDEGMYFPLKGGTEVLLTFLNGDPDRPIISSALPNASTPSLLTDKTSTESIIKTGANNKIRMEDKKGSERIIMESPTSNSWVRIGAPNDPSDPFTVAEGRELARYTDGDGIWKLVEVDGVSATSRIADSILDGKNVKYRLIKSFSVWRGSYLVTNTTPETPLSGLPPTINSNHQIEGITHRLTDDLSTNPISDGVTRATDFNGINFDLRNDSNTYQVGADPLSGFSPSIGSSHTISGKTWILDEDINASNIDSDSSKSIRFYRDKSVVLQVETSGADVDLGPGIRMRTGGNLWLEAMGQFGDYYVGKPTDAPSGIQPILNNFGTSYHPTGLKNYEDGSTIDFSNTTPASLGAIQQGHVRVSKLDTFNTQEGNIYDFGGYWNYNLGNSYAENHIDQKAVLNVKHVGDPTDDPWSKTSTGFDGDVIAGPGSGAIASNFNKVSMHMDSAWVEKAFGDSYSYSKGNTLEISHGNTESHSKGDTYEFSYGGRSEQTKYTGGGTKTFHSWSASGKGEETTWDRYSGFLTSYKFKHHTPVLNFTYEAKIPSIPTVNISTTATTNTTSISVSFATKINLSTHNALVLDLQFNNSAYIKADTGFGVGINIVAKVGGEFEIKPIVGKYKWEGNGIQAQKDAALKAKKEGLVLTALTAEMNKSSVVIKQIATWLGKTELEVKAGIVCHV